MKITDLWNSFSRHAREMSNWLNHPVDNVKRLGGRWVQTKVEETEIPLGNNHGDSDKSTKTNSNQNKANSVYPELENNYTFENNGYTSNGVNGHSRSRSNLYAENNLVVVKEKEELPILSSNQYIQSFKGRYKIGKLRKEYIRIREYEGLTYPQKKSVLIKEYLLQEKDFSDNSEAEKRQREFVKRANLKLKSTQVNNGINGQDFRLLTPVDAFADKRRCYIISQSNQNYITLREYLDENPSMDYEEVRTILKRVLQSLYFLHNQSILLGNSELPSGLVHGNISVDSLLIDTKRDINFVYLSDFAFWEDVVKPQNFKNINEYSAPLLFQDDLKDLGKVAIKLLFWNHIIRNDIDIENPIDTQYLLATIYDIRLKDFILKLRGIDGKFNNTKEAYEEISNLPFEPRQPKAKLVEPGQIKEKDKKQGFSKIKLIFLLLLSFGLIALSIALIASLLPKKNIDVSSTVNNSEKASCKDPKSNCYIGKKEFNASIITDSMVSDWMQEKNLVSYNNSFKTELKENYNITLNIPYVNNELRKISEIKKQLNEIKTLDFAITNLSDNSQIKKCNNIASSNINKDEFNKLKCKIIAYDGIVFFVPFSDARGEDSIPKSLNGNINKNDLAKLYQSKIADWNQLGLKKSLPVELYEPEEKHLIDSFIQFITEPNGSTTIAKRETTKFDSMLQKILQGFEETNPENRYGGIGFGLLRKVYGQCSVYPLAINGVQTLAHNDGKPITPNIDLCNDKGSYRLNTNAFKSGRYPLRFAIAVIYKTTKDEDSKGEKFAEMMLSDEGQSLLQEIGLVPARDIY
ncbi:MAG: substrate-binding domain-containing protein [Rivularia sp. (in: Bacteria)]|nr:substrate-binding domain-containing protein [Rivularia sp. MS3]